MKGKILNLLKRQSAEKENMLYEILEEELDQPTEPSTEPIFTKHNKEPEKKEPIFRKGCKKENCWCCKNHKCYSDAVNRGDIRCDESNNYEGFESRECLNYEDFVEKMRKL